MATEIQGLPTHKVDELEDAIDTASLEASMSYSLADAIREGSTVTDQCIGGWTGKQGEEACALTAAAIAAKARHLL